MKMVVDSQGSDKVLGYGHIFLAIMPSRSSSSPPPAHCVAWAPPRSDFDGTDFAALHPTAAEELVTMRTEELFQDAVTQGWSSLLPLAVSNLVCTA